METSTLRFGRGIIREVGHDLEDMGAKRVAVVTDPRLRESVAFERAVSAIEARKIEARIYDQARCEPTDASMREAAVWARGAGRLDAFVAIGGGSSIDTAKVANLMHCHPDNEIDDFVNAPIGKGLPIPNALRPLIAIVTTAGTGSEATGTAIFDHTEAKAKTGIGHRRLRPTLGLCDPDAIGTMPRDVAMSSGLDVLCHAIESYTAVAYDARTPRPLTPAERPAYQGANPLSDVWSLHALGLIKDAFVPSLDGDGPARESMALAAACAGVAFGNAGVHLPHAMSYPISGLNKLLPHVQYRQPGYGLPHPLIPHGVSVTLPAPAVFRYTAHACPERHRECARVLGADVSNCASDDGEHAGRLLADALVKLMDEVGLPLGLAPVGFASSDVGALVDGTLPQQRLTKMAPCAASRDALGHIFEDAMSYR